MEDLSNKVASFEKYYKEYASLFPNKNVSYYGKFKKNYKDFNINHIDNVKWNDIKFTILIGSDSDYRIGYMTDCMFYYLRSGVLTLLPIEHRFFAGLFKNLTVEDEREIDYFVSTASNDVRYSIIEDIYDNIDKIYPEFKINFIIEKIKHYLKV
jgi:hypothetical protein